MHCFDIWYTLRKIPIQNQLNKKLSTNPKHSIPPCWYILNIKVITEIQLSIQGLSH